MQDVQSAWLLHLHCASARANYQIRSVNLTAVEEFARTHDENVWQCLGRILNIDPAQCNEEIRDSATLPLVLGGLGLRSASRLRVPAFWASWGDCLPMILERHPAVATQLINQLEGHPRTPNLAAASDAVRALGGLRGFELHSWRDLAGGARPVEFDPDNFELGQTRASWQHEVVSRIDAAFRDSLFSRMADSAVAAIRSQGGSGAGLVLTCCPTCRVTKMEAHLFRVTLLRRLQLPLLLTVRTCQCGLPLDSLGHHRGVLWESEGGLWGGRVTTNVLLRDLDLGFVGSEADGRRLEIVVDGLPICSAQLAVDTLSVCAAEGCSAHHPSRCGRWSQSDKSTKAPAHAWWCSEWKWVAVFQRTVILDPAGSSQGQVREPHLASAGRAGVAPEVGFSLGLHRRPTSRCVTPGIALSPRCGRGHTCFT